MPRKLPESTRQAIVQQYLAGVPTGLIAKDFDVSESYPSQLAARYNLQRRISVEHREAISEGKRTSLADCLVDEIAMPVGPAPMNVNSAAEIRRLAAMGKGRTQIAALLRCPYREVEEALS